MKVKRKCGYCGKLTLFNLTESEAQLLIYKNGEANLNKLNSAEGFNFICNDCFDEGPFGGITYFGHRIDTMIGQKKEQP